MRYINKGKKMLSVKLISQLNRLLPGRMETSAPFVIVTMLKMRRTRLTIRAAWSLSLATRNTVSIAVA
jgi:hypothetical protein